MVTQQAISCTRRDNPRVSIQNATQFTAMWGMKFHCMDAIYIIVREESL
jgi:hypothetical protein